VLGTEGLSRVFQCEGRLLRGGGVGKERWTRRENPPLGTITWLAEKNENKTSVHPSLVVQGPPCFERAEHGGGVKESGGGC